MVQQAAEEVTEYLLDLIGDHLRAVVVVTADGFDIAHLDGDLQRRYSTTSFAEVVDTFRLDDPLFEPDIDGYPIGERRAVLHYHENAFVLQFPYSASETILISVTRDVGRDLLGFIEECRQLVWDRR